MNKLSGPGRFLASVTSLAMVCGLFLAAPATAAPLQKTHCTGFVACALEHLDNFGYSIVYKLGFWRATAGHNCTNYVSYRLSHHGRLVDRPSNLGNASEWGINAAKEGIPVVAKPKVGDVAWWSFHKGSSTRSHVAMVERIHSDGSILVSEDNLNGNFNWRTVYKGERFPSGFIRFPQSDGTPHGFMKPTTNEAGRVQINGYADEADSPDRKTNVVVSWGGPRGVKGTIESPLSRPLNGNFFSYRTFASGKIPKVAYVYADNTDGTRGKDFAYGKVNILGGQIADLGPSAPPPVTPPEIIAPTKPPAVTWPVVTPKPAPKIYYKTTASMKIKDKSIRKKIKAKVTITVKRTSKKQYWPTGKVNIYEGKRLIWTKTYYSNNRGRYTFTLPKFRKGKHKIRARYFPNSNSKASTSSTQTIKVRK